MTYTPCAMPHERSELGGRKSCFSSVSSRLFPLFSAACVIPRSSRCSSLWIPAGYQCEVDALLCVNKQRRFSRDEEHLNKATELLTQLLDHTSLFPPGTGHQNRYLCIMVHANTHP